MKRFKETAKCWVLLFIIIIAAVIISFYHVRPVIISNARSRAKNIMTNAVNKAVVKVLRDNGFTYSDLAVVSRDEGGNITGIEIDSQKANIFKSEISDEVYGIISKNDYHTVAIPLGDFFFNGYTNGFGPKIKFRMELAHTETVDFKSEFSDAGINNVLHKIILDIRLSGSILITGATSPVSIKTSAIVAQTVIAGRVPDSFTNVDEYPGEDIADEIFNYADK